ncbi:MAG: GNAT family N-acetyltransferase [Acidimicrobiaceae bacterium]|nr:GNAT family N-acetyltransferase [Acidimicrobiaceae bacterium]
MSPVRRGMKKDASLIAQRVADQLSRDALIEPLVSDQFSRQEFELAISNSTNPWWVDDASGRIRGHLYGTTLEDSLFGRQTWTGPDGYSYEVLDVLDNLCEQAYRSWRQEGSNAHLVWALAGSGTQDWLERGYRMMSVRAARALEAVEEFTWPHDYRLRRGTLTDLATALEFDGLIDRAQGVDPETLTAEQRSANRADLENLLDDPECYYYLVDIDGSPAAQCVTFPLPALRGNFANTLHIGSLAVSPAFRRQGLATMMMREIMNSAFGEGFAYAEVRWHIDNRLATPFWPTLGFRPTYVQLRRTLKD